MKQNRSAPTLEDRIEQIRTEIERVVQDRVEVIARESPGVPKGVIRNLLVARAPSCACEQYLMLRRPS
jgi:hypothetical protein